MRVSVFPIKYSDAVPWVLYRHYAARECPVSYAFGAYMDGVLVGVVTYGVPSSAPLRGGICGPKYAGRVLELNRLCCESVKNLAGILISRSLKMLPKPSIIVSYADTAQGHVGYVYQACNFIYTGLSAKRTDWKIKGMEHLHGATVADMSRGESDRVGYMRERYGDDFYLLDRPRKHRYIYFVGPKRDKREMKSRLRYEIMPYPKGDSCRYESSGVMPSQGVMF